MFSQNRWYGTTLVYVASAFALLLLAHAEPALAQPPVAPAPPVPKVAIPEPVAETAVEPAVPSVPPVPPAATRTPRPGGTRVAPPSAPRPSTPSRTRQPASTPSLDQFAMRTRGTPSLRLASVPNMLGDFGVLYQKANVDTVNGSALLSLPLAGSGMRTKVSENNKALPMDRVYFQYNHFHNAVNTDFDIATTGNEITGHLDRYTIGLEKTFLNKLWSVDLRMPFASSENFASADVEMSNGAVGNLSVIVKRLLAVNRYGALAAGIGINTPTGSDVNINTYRNYSVENEAVHLSPFVGALYQPNDRLFYHAFLEVDVPLNGNSVTYDEGYGPEPAGLLTEQTLLQADVSAGYWLYRNPYAYMTGLASLVEFHYTGTLDDGDVIDVGDRFGGLLNRLDLAHLTVGLHAVLHENTTLRVGGVFPLSDAPDRAFDAEIQVSLNRYF